MQHLDDPPGDDGDPQKLYMVWFHLYSIPEMIKLQKWGAYQWLPRVTNGVGVALKRQHER